MESDHIYKLLAEGSIRLLSVTSIDERLSCEFSEYRLSHYPYFEAGSYSWGDNEAIYILHYEGQELRITPNVGELIRQLYLWDPPRKVWIDAVCVNQADNTEKEHQVRRMHETYFAAERVLVWLGKAENDSDLAIDGIPALNKRLRYLESKIAPDVRNFLGRNLERLGLPEATDPIWPPLNNLFRRRWFTRLWVVQEVMLARRITVLCGNRTADWETLAECAKLMNCVGLIEVLAGKEWMGNYPNGIRAICNLSTSIESQTIGDPLFFQLILYEGRFREGKEPIDRVYGFLGLASRRLRIQIPVDYSTESKKHYWKTYINWGKLSIAEDPYLTIPSHAHSEYKPLGLPSWCSNLNSSLAFSSNLRLSPGNQAGFDIRLSKNYLPMFKPGTASIHLPCFCTDRVNHVACHPSQGPSLLSFGDYTKSASETLE